MPKQITKSTYKCVYCGKEYDSEDQAKRHESIEHDIIWLGLERSDLNRLINFIATHDDKSGILTESLITTLYRYSKAK